MKGNQKLNIRLTYSGEKKNKNNQRLKYRSIAIPGGMRTFFIFCVSSESSVELLPEKKKFDQLERVIT